MPVSASKLRRFLVMALALTSALVLVRVGPDDSTFLVTAQTEVVSATTDEGDAIRWMVTPAAYSSDGREVLVSPEHTVLRITGSVRIDVHRISRQKVQISITATDSNASVSIYTLSEEPLQERLSNLVVEIDPLQELEAETASLVLPLVGNITVGRTAGVETVPGVPVMRSGSIEVLDRAWLIGSVFVSNSLDLTLGDEFVVPEQTEPARALMVVNEGAALSTVVRYVGQAGRIRHYGGEGYQIRTTYWSRITKDPLVLAAWAMIFFLTPKLLKKKTDKRCCCSKPDGKGVGRDP